MLAKTLLAGCAAAAAVFSGPAAAQSYPSKFVKFVVTYPAAALDVPVLAYVITRVAPIGAGVEA